MTFKEPTNRSHPIVVAIVCLVVDAVALVCLLAYVLVLSVVCLVVVAVAVVCLMVYILVVAVACLVAIAVAVADAVYRMKLCVWW